MEPNLRSALNQYANREIDLNQFEDWVVANLQLILDSHDQESIDLVNTLDARLIDLGEDLITEQDFFNEAQAMLPPPATQTEIVLVGITQLTGSITVTASSGESHPAVVLA